MTTLNQIKKHHKKTFIFRIHNTFEEMSFLAYLVMPWISQNVFAF